MQISRIISSVTVERLKQKARKLKRERSITHTQALDQIAVSAGFNHWHQVVKANDLLKPSEIALSLGCVMAFDVKDGMDVDTSDGVLIEDHFLEALTQNQLFEIYANSPDEDDEQNRPLKETLSDSELHEYFQDDCTFMYFRLVETHASKSLKELLPLIRQYSFWMPQYIWLQGHLIDTYHLPIEDENGNTIGVRF
ncbi:hypothetical protein [Vibrio nigripulchritudo]|uniref:hypothetical protein n=1 Tax=Vibrio nigripulchritudo TaxID=28173 RepID=UPI0003B2193C|nr:hypothetical protein [Vibrio nigripulchritudo]CCN85990.1 conserved hypothetical protein [Vibrio nigripulchritudo BLFn1]CCN97788.1 conserved hypothetical protein [Vibrio nigripulchritudo ENn2]CCO56099.1 conserved hypothetical protein [Vibrio nigripulchritudo Wn13]